MGETERVDIYKFIPPPLPLLDREFTDSVMFNRVEKSRHSASLPRDTCISFRGKQRKPGGFTSKDTRSARFPDQSSLDLNASSRLDSSNLPPLQYCLCKCTSEDYQRTRENLGSGQSVVPIAYRDNVEELFEGSLGEATLVYQRVRPRNFRSWVSTLIDPNLPHYHSGEAVTSVSCPIHKSKVLQRSHTRNDSLLTHDFSFDSEFEGGNLDRVIKTKDGEFHLFLTCDSNTKGYTQWFYFSVRNARKNATVAMLVMNMAKNGSPFGRGMKPMTLSLARQKRLGIGWTRGCHDVRYLKSPLMKATKGNYYSLGLTYTFQYEHDTVYFAYAEPYTYTKLSRFLGELGEGMKTSTDISYEERTLGETVGGLRCPILIITDSNGPQPAKKLVGISARVHPGETVGSYMAEGFIKFITSNTDEAINLRKNCIFYIIPMLNPDGVVLGNTRTGLEGVDLNRKWDRPSPILHPIVYLAKEMMREAVCFVDLHGHSKKDFAFMYGNSFNRKDERYWSSRFLPLLLSKLTSNFNYSLCYFFNSHSHDKAARTVMWQERGVTHSFTLEASFNGCSSGEKKVEFSPVVLREIGWKLGEAVYGLVGVMMKRPVRDTSTQEGLYSLANLVSARLRRDRNKRTPTSSAPLPEPLPESPSPGSQSSGSDSEPEEDVMEPEETETLHREIARLVEERKETRKENQEKSFTHVTSSNHFKDPLEGVMFRLEELHTPVHPYKRNTRPMILKRQQQLQDTAPNKLISSYKYTEVLKSLRRTRSPQESHAHNSGFESYIQFVRAVRQKMTKPRLPPM